jgi:parallel beta-helix repeat protein
MKMERLRRKAASEIFLALLFSGVFILAFNIQQVKAEPTTIIVPDDYSTIQEAINNANPGDTVSVKAGLYHEQVVLRKPLSLVGENAASTIIEGGETFGAVVRVTGNSINISGFTVQNSPIGDVGIWLDHSTNCAVSRCEVRNIGTSNAVGGAGIELDYCEGCTVEKSNVNDNNQGIVLALSHGCTVHGNIVDKNNKFAGIDMHFCSECMILENVLSSNEKLGIRINSSAHCILKGNNITRSGQNFGVYGYELSAFVHDIDSSNTINGKPIVYLVNGHNLTVDPSTYPTLGYLAVVNSTNIIAENLTVGHNGEGVLLAYANNSIITGVTTSHNDYGIYLFNCNNCTVTENTATNNIYGICLWYSYNCMVTDNIVPNNEMSIRLHHSSTCVVNGNQEQTILFYMEWWFWAIVATIVILFASAIYFLKKRRASTSAASSLLTEGTT